MMKGYPIILTRTYDCDYFWGFHVKPSFLDQTEAKKFITAATAQIDELNGSRQVVFSNDKYTVIGIVAYTADIIAASNLDPEKKQALEQYTADIRGRKIYGFWGFVCERSQVSICVPSYNDYVNIFGKYILPVWANKTQDPSIAEQPVDINGAGAYGIIPNAELNYNGKKLYNDSSDMFGAFINKSMTSAVSFCSGIVSAKSIKESVFENIQTDDSTIANLNYVIEQEKEQALQQERERIARQEEEKKRAASSAPGSFSQKNRFGEKSSDSESYQGHQGSDYGSKCGKDYSGSYSSESQHTDKPWTYNGPKPDKKKQVSPYSHPTQENRSSLNPLIIGAAVAAGAVIILLIVMSGGK